MSARSALQERRRLTLLIAGVALALRVAAMLVTGALLHPQLYEYDAIATSILQGEGFTYQHFGVPYRSITAPFYPYVCAAVYAVSGGSPTPLLFLQMAAGAANAVLIARLAERLFGFRAGLASGLLVAVHPGLIVYSALKVHSLTFDALWFSVVVWQVIRLREEPTLARSVWAGLAIGASMLSRPTGLLFFLVPAGWLIVMTPSDQRRKALARAAVMGVCALLVIAPWLIRNALVYHRLEFVQNAEVFWRGNNPHATGHSYIDAQRPVMDTLSPVERVAFTQLPDEDAQARWFTRQALAFIREDPGRFVALTMAKFWSFWWFSPQSGVLYPRWWRYGYQLFYVGLLCLTLLAVQRIVACGSGPQRSASWLILLLLVSVSVFQSLCYVEGRHRWGVEPLMLLWAGAGAARVWGLVSASLRGRVCAGK